jgi:hypothetical protein
MLLDESHLGIPAWQTPLKPRPISRFGVHVSLECISIGETRPILHFLGPDPVSPSNPCLLFMPLATRWNPDSHFCPTFFILLTHGQYCPNGFPVPLKRHPKRLGIIYLVLWKAIFYDQTLGLHQYFISSFFKAVGCSSTLTKINVELIISVMVLLHGVQVYSEIHKRAL